MASEYQKWLKRGQELGLVADELKVFVRERQEEVKAERKLAFEAEREEKETNRDANFKRLEIEATDKRLAAEANLKCLEMEVADKRFAAEKEKEERETRLIAEEKEKDREANLKHLEIEATERRLAAKEKEKEKDREANLKRLEIESQERIRIKELDLRLSLERRPEERSVIIGQGDMRADNYGRIRDIQMPVFDELLDDLDAWLHRFQRSCEALRINKDLWVLALVKSLKGPALEVYERMSAEDAQDYDKLKEELLKRFRLTEGGYRKKFKGATREKDETAPQFGERLKRYLDKWLQMSGFEEDYDGLRSLILRDQFLVKCDDEVRCFLKQKGKLDLEETLTQAQYFFESKETSENKWLPGGKSGRKDFKTNVRVVDQGNAVKPSDKPNENKDPKGHQDKGLYHSPWYASKPQQHGNRDSRGGGCYICGDQSHRAFSCPKRHGSDAAYRNAVMLCTEEKEHVEMGEDETQAMMSMLEASDDQKKNEDEVYGDFIDTVKVNGRRVQCLYDTGTTKAALKQGLEKPEQYNGKFARCKFPNGTSIKYPLANVEVEGEYFKGLVEVMVVPNLLKDMIITPKQYIRPIKQKNFSSRGNHDETIRTNGRRIETAEMEVQTDELAIRCIEEEESDRDDVSEETVANYALRSQTGEVKNRVVKTLKWPVLKDEKLSPAKVLEMQKNDPTLEMQQEDSTLDGRRVKTYSLNQLKKNVKRRNFESSRDDVVKKATEALNGNEEERTEARMGYKDYFIGRGKINGREVKCWCNPRVATVVIKRELVRPDQYTGRYKWCTITGKVRRRYPLAKIILEGEEFEGNGDAVVVPGLRKDVILTSGVYEQVKSNKESVRLRAHDKMTKREDLRRVNRYYGRGDQIGRQTNGEQNRVQDHHRKFQDENKRFGRGENSNWRIKNNDQVDLEVIVREGRNKHESSCNARDKGPCNDECHLEKRGRDDKEVIYSIEEEDDPGEKRRIVRNKKPEGQEKRVTKSVDCEEQCNDTELWKYGHILTQDQPIDERVSMNMRISEVSSHELSVEKEKEEKIITECRDEEGHDENKCSKETKERKRERARLTELIEFLRDFEIDEHMTPSEAWDAGYYDKLERLGYRFADEDSSWEKESK